MPAKKRNSQPNDADARAAIVDRFHDLSKRCEEFKPIADEREKLRKTIQAWVASDVPADHVSTFQGISATATVGACDLERRVNLRAAARLMGARFWHVATLALKHLETFAAEDLAGIITQARTGSRRVTVEARVA